MSHLVHIQQFLGVFRHHGNPAVQVAVQRKAGSHQPVETRRLLSSIATRSSASATRLHDYATHSRDLVIDAVVSDTLKHIAQHFITLCG
jgi:hypothetical protein